MAEKREVIAGQLRELADDLKGLTAAIVHDPKEQKRKQRNWNLLTGVLTTAFSIGGRQVAVRIWGTLTGERPPGRR